MTVSGSQPDSPVGGEGVETVAGSAAVGLTAGSESHRTPGERIDDLRALLAVTIAHPKMPSDIRRYEGGDECARCVRALDAADAVIEVGFVRVVDDEETVERVAEAMWFGPPAWDARIVQQLHAPIWRAKARAAVHALRDGNSQPTPSSSQPGSSHACCPHCSTKPGSCVRCGVRDAEDGEQLCGQCDREVEAEVAAESAALRDGSGT